MSRTAQDDCFKRDTVTKNGALNSSNTIKVYLF